VISQLREHRKVAFDAPVAWSVPQFAGYALASLNSQPTLDFPTDTPRKYDPSLAQRTWLKLLPIPFQAALGIVMRTIWTVGWLLSATASSVAQTSFQPARPVQPEGVVTLECIPVQANGQDRDRIYKLLVTLQLQNGTPTNLTVIHVATSGVTYNRADQYPISDLRQVQGATIYYWVGVFIKNPSITMKGTLALTGGRWTYGEEQFQNGRKGYWNFNVCNVQQGLE
jgi:hypothetical protein